MKMDPLTETLITAEFKGEDMSLGYRRGVQYLLVIKQERSAGSPRAIQIRPYADTKGTIQPNEYGSLKAFLYNWKDINLIET